MTTAHGHVDGPSRVGDGRDTLLGRLRTALRTTTALAASSVAGQAFLAGELMDGNSTALQWHRWLGVAVPVLGAFVLVCVALSWSRAVIPWWVPVTGVVLVGGAAEQIHSGFVRLLTVHVPLAVAITVAAAGLLVWAWRGDPLGRRRTTAPVPAPGDLGEPAASAGPVPDRTTEAS